MDLNEVDLEDLQRVLHRTAYTLLEDSNYTGDPTEEARDLVQDTMLALLEYEGDGNPYKLGATMIQRDTLDLLKTSARRREIEQDHGDEINSMLTNQSADTMASDPAEIMAYEEMRDRLDALSPLLYNTTRRHYIDGRTVIEIAIEDSVPPDTVYKRLQRARNFIESGEDYGETH
jgi:RNA polymerase sigma factor (sigma-70 family)